MKKSGLLFLFCLSFLLSSCLKDEDPQYCFHYSIEVKVTVEKDGKRVDYEEGTQTHVQCRLKEEEAGSFAETINGVTREDLSDGYVRITERTVTKYERII